MTTVIINKEKTAPAISERTSVRPKERIIPGITSRIPPVNISETGNEFLLTLATPGFKREEFTIEIIDNHIRITARKNASHKNNVPYHNEYDLKKWMRSFLLPADANVLMTNARYEAGELIIQIPRRIHENSVNDLIKIYVY